MWEGFDGTRLSVSLKVILANYQVIPERIVVLDTAGLQCGWGASDFTEDMFMEWKHYFKAICNHTDAWSRHPTRISRWR